MSMHCTHALLQVRVVGSTHSWSPLYPDEGHILIDGTGLKMHNGEKIRLNRGNSIIHTIIYGAGIIN